MNAVCGERFAGDVDHAAAAEIFESRNISALPELDELFERSPFRETDHPKVARMDTQQQPRPLIDGLLVILNASAVRGPNFLQDCAASGHNFRNSEGPADFNLLAARRDNFT